MVNTIAIAATSLIFLMNYSRMRNAMTTNFAVTTPGGASQENGCLIRKKKIAKTEVTKNSLFLIASGWNTDVEMGDASHGIDLTTVTRTAYLDQTNQLNPYLAYPMSTSAYILSDVFLVFGG